MHSHMHECMHTCKHRHTSMGLHTCIRAFVHKGEMIGRRNRKREREGEDNSERGRRIDARLELGLNVIELSGVRRQEQDKQVTTLWPRDAYSHCEGVLVHTMV